MRHNHHRGRTHVNTTSVPTAEPTQWRLKGCTQLLVLVAVLAYARIESYVAVVDRQHYRVGDQNDRNFANMPSRLQVRQAVGCLWFCFV